MTSRDASDVGGGWVGARHVAEPVGYVVAVARAGDLDDIASSMRALLNGIYSAPVSGLQAPNG